MTNNPDPFLHGFIEGRRVLIEKLRETPTLMIREILDYEDQKDRRTAKNLHIDVSVY